METVVGNKRKSKYFKYEHRVPITVLGIGLSKDALKLIGNMSENYLDSDSDFNKRGWMAIPKSFLYAVFGGEYPKVIQELLDNDIIRVRIFDSGRTYSFGIPGESGICKHYQFTDYHYKAIKDGMVKTILSEQYRTYYNNKPKKITSENHINKVAVNSHHLNNALLKAYDKVTLEDSWQDQLWNIETRIDDAISKEKNFFADWGWVKQIGQGDITVIVGDTDRLYHPAILMRKPLRDFVRYNGESVCSIDVKACHPHLLGFWSIPEEKDKWLKICENDIYSLFTSEKITRDDVKKAFQVAISYCPQGKGKLAESILELIKSVSPSIYASLEAIWHKCQREGKTNNTPQCILQKLEASIFIEGSFIPLSKKFWCIPIHDGLMVERKNIKKAIEHVGKVSEEIIGYKLPLDIKHH